MLFKNAKTYFLGLFFYFVDNRRDNKGDNKGEKRFSPRCSFIFSSLPFLLVTQSVTFLYRNSLRGKGGGIKSEYIFISFYDEGL